MNKVEVIARRVLDWKLTSWEKWYDHENERFIYQFEPDKKLEHAQMIVDKLQQLGYIYEQKSNERVCFDQVCASGKTLAEAITNAAYEIAENDSAAEEWL